MTNVSVARTVARCFTASTRAAASAKWKGIQMMPRGTRSLTAQGSRSARSAVAQLRFFVRDDMRMTKTWMLIIGLPITAIASADAAESKTVLFSESFDDAKLAQRNWYDGTEFRIVGDARAGRGCIEYEWLRADAKVSGSSGVRHSFEPTDEVCLRFYLKLSKGWGWSGRNYHPHLLHFMTTENSKWHGPAASHLTLYIEPVNGKLRLAAQDIQNKDSPHGLTQGPLKGGYNGTFFDSKDELFTDDQWHCIEACFKLNTLDLKNDRPNRDSIVRIWFDG